MSDFLLIHGSCHGAWCWRDTVPALQALGHTARAIDLPSHGDDVTPVGQITLDTYAQAILDAIDTPVILVGHSMAGYPITRAATLGPAKIARLIYLCAYVPVAGQTLADRRRAAPSQPLMDAIRVDATRTSFTVDPVLAVDRFYHDLPPDTARWAVENLCPQAILPQETAFDPAPAQGIPRRYIRCTDDRTIPPEWQATMTADWPPAHVGTMSTSHSPFLSAPRDLAAMLSRLAQD